MIVAKIRDINVPIVENTRFSLLEIFHENSKLHDVDGDFFYNIDIILKTPYILKKIAKSYKTYPGYTSITLPEVKKDNLLKKLIKCRGSEEFPNWGQDNSPVRVRIIPHFFSNYVIRFPIYLCVARRQVKNERGSYGKEGDKDGRVSRDSVSMAYGT